jgi:hypothetical protein
MAAVNLHRLLDKTHHLLRHCGIPWTEVAIGAAVSYTWLKKFRTGQFIDPGVMRVQRLHDFLVLHRRAMGKEAPPLPELPPPVNPERRASAFLETSNTNT